MNVNTHAAQMNTKRLTGMGAVATLALAVLVFGCVLAATAGRATLLITHDLGGLDQVDEIVVLDQGRVTERGTHAQLLQADGLYERMWRLQSESSTAGDVPLSRAVGAF